MTTSAKGVGSILAGLLLSSVQSVAGAQTQTQWTIAYAPVTSAALPTLSQWGLWILAALVAGAAAVSLRKRARNRTLVSVVMLGAFVAGGFSVDRAIRDAYAIAGPAMSDPAGGTLSFAYSGISFAIPNTSGVAQKITSITPTVSVATTSPTCAVGLVVPAGGNCYVADALAISDQRLKREIRYLATLDNGVKIYAFRYLWDDDVHVGVMAQDLLQSPVHRHAVVLDNDGYYKVDYRALGMRMISLSEWDQSPRNIFTDPSSALAFKDVAALALP